ncbi:MAG: hypothetical protein R6X33_19320 [Candidatus Brocadiia bacterium]
MALIVRESRACWVHVGDSRLYLFRDRELRVRTRDHSLVQELVEAGQVAEEAMATHPDQNKLLRSIGGEYPPETTHGSASIRPQDRFLLCSDGFWEQIAAEEMSAALAASNLEESLTDLVDLAVRRAGPSGDNVAVAAVRELAEGGGNGFA